MRAYSNVRARAYARTHASTQPKFYVPRNLQLSTLHWPECFHSLPLPKSTPLFLFILFNETFPFCSPSSPTFSPADKTILCKALIHTMCFTCSAWPVGKCARQASVQRAARCAPRVSMVQCHPSSRQPVVATSHMSTQAPSHLRGWPQITEVMSACHIYPILLHRECAAYWWVPVRPFCLLAPVRHTGLW